jgi:hypothetical protein
MGNNNLAEYVRRSASKYISFAIFFAVLIVLLPHNYGRIKLEFNRAKWRAQNVAHYRYQLQIVCHCLLTPRPPLTIEVLDDEIVSIVDVDGKMFNWSGKDSMVFGKNQTMEGLFDQIQKAIPEDNQILTNYDKKYGFPSFILFDPEYYTIDDEHIYQISNFEVLP